MTLDEAWSLVLVSEITRWCFCLLLFWLLPKQPVTGMLLLLVLRRSPTGASRQALLHPNPFSCSAEPLFLFPSTSLFVLSSSFVCILLVAVHLFHTKAELSNE